MKQPDPPREPHPTHGVPASVGVPVLAASRATFRAVAATVVPGAEKLNEDGWREVEAIVERALAARPEKMRRQLATFLRLIGWLPVFRYGRTFRSLDAIRRVRFLSGLERSRVLLVRRGFWGLRTLIFMGFYGRRAAAGEIGYRASKDGWDARRPDVRATGEVDAS
jgi:hypothetical protein